MENVILSNYENVILLITFGNNKWGARGLGGRVLAFNGKELI